MTSSSRRGGDPRSPEDPLFREAIYRLSGSTPVRNQVAWIGFNNQIAYGFSGGEMVWEVASLLSRGFRDRLCFKALMRVRTTSTGARITVLHVGPDAVYALNYNNETGRVAWAKPDQFDLTYLRQLNDW